MSQEHVPDDLARWLEDELAFRVARVDAVRGGDIHRAHRLTSDRGERLFLKSNENAPLAMFEREADGLDWLAETGALRVPRVIQVSDSREGIGSSWLLLEWLEPEAPRADYDELLGHGLAALHSCGAPAVGGSASNYIGTLPQSNRARASWAEFYALERLSPQVERAVTRGCGPARWRARFSRLIEALPAFLGEEEAPSRLHGDLWSGNVLAGPGGAPCLIDPACYAGHREVDLAMMQLFGGFSGRVFSAYDSVLPRSPGASDRVPLYQLYPLLVHVNLFGGSYVSMVDAALTKLP